MPCSGLTGRNGMAGFQAGVLPSGMAPDGYPKTRTETSGCTTSRFELQGTEISISIQRFCHVGIVIRALVHVEMRMKVNASVKKMCRKCKIIKRKGVVRVICADPRHKQRQG